jgi:uncharacterized membrane protein
MKQKLKKKKKMKKNDSIVHKVWNIVENNVIVFLFHQEYVFFQKNYKDLVVHLE